MSLSRGDNRFLHNFFKVYTDWVRAAKSLANVDTLYSADSIEFCPFEGFQDLLVCGTYQIVEPKEGGKKPDEDGSDDEQPPNQTQRVGRLLLFQVSQGHHL